MQLYFLEKGNVIADNYTNDMLAKLVKDCHDLLSDVFIFLHMK